MIGFGTADPKYETCLTDDVGVYLWTDYFYL